MKAKYLIVIVIAFVSFTDLHAQQDGTNSLPEIPAYRYWMTAGLGFSETHYAYTHLSYQFSIENNFYKVEYLNRSWDILGGPDLK